MDIRNGSLLFETDEATAIRRVFQGDAAAYNTDSFDFEASKAPPVMARRIARSLHGVITDSRLPESQREEAANQLEKIALTGLRSSVEADKQFMQYQHSVSRSDPPSL